MNDQFQLAAVADLQNSLLAHLADNPADVVVKIAALRAAADLMAQSVAVTALAAGFAAALNPRR